MCAVRATTKVTDPEPRGRARDATARSGPETIDRGGCLAKRIRDRRYAIGWGPDELATRAKISRTALYHIENGQTRHPRAQTIMGIADALGIDIAELMGEEAAKPTIRVAKLGSSLHDTATTPEITWRGVAKDLRGKIEDLLASPIGPAFVEFLEVAHGLIVVVNEQTAPSDRPIADRRSCRGVGLGRMQAEP